MLRAVSKVSTGRGGSRLARHIAPALSRGKAGTWMPGPCKPDTDFVHAAVTPEPGSGAVLTPLYLSTTFVQDSVEEYLAKGFSYSRTNNPTVSALESKLGVMENGFGAVAFGTGMAATTNCISATMKAGDHC